MSRVNPGCLIEGSGGFEPRKRKPRLDASLKICSNFVNDVLSKKHKVRWFCFWGNCVTIVFYNFYTFL